MPQIVNVPGHGQVSFPDGMSDDQIVAAIKANAPQQLPEAATRPESPAFGNYESASGFNPSAAAIEAGSWIDRLNRGATKLMLGPTNLGMQMAGAPDMFAGMNADSAQNNKAMEQLRSVHPGSTQLGDAAIKTAIPPALLPALGAVEDATLPQKLMNSSTALLGNAGAQWLGQKAAGQYAASKASAATSAGQNAVRDQTLADAQALGYQIPPSTTNPSFFNRKLEGLSGKAATQQAVSANNAGITDSIARRALGLPDSAPLTEKAAQGVRQAAYQAGYAPVENAGKMAATPAYGAALDAITAKNTSAAQSFPGAAATDIQGVVDSFRPPNGVFDAAHAVKATQILRDQATDAFRQGDGALGAAKLQVSKAIEDELERQLAAQGQPDALKAFQAARKQIAIAHTVEDAIRTGSGSVENAALARAAQKGVPLSGELKTAGEFANVFPKANQRLAQIGSPGVSKLEGTLAASLGIGGAGLGHAIAGPMGATAGGMIGGLAPMVVPEAARSLLLSPAYQRIMGRAQYPVEGLLGRTLLDNPYAPAIAGLLGYQAAQ